MCVNCGVSSCSSCNTNSYIPDSTSALKYDGPKFVCPTDFTVLPGAPLNDVMNTLMGKICANSSGGGGGFIHYLGEEFEGGIIYYLWKDGGGVEHGLIVNKNEQPGPLNWQNTAVFVNANRTEDGAYNTVLMTDSPVADYVNALTDSGFNDWYLPSVDELNLLWDNRFHAQKALRAGSFTLLDTVGYWSSTEYTTTNAYYFNFGSGNAINTNKTNTYSVRAVRAF